MTWIRKYFIQQDIKIDVATVKYQRPDGRYAVDVKGKTRIVRSSQGNLSPGRRVIVSKVGNGWHVTDDLKNFENTRTTTVIVNA